MWKKYEIVIWLEIHVKLNSKTKLFCSCKNDQDFENIKANQNICPVCTWQPGALPVLQTQALEKWVLLWLALNCSINKLSNFDRKSYFYPDLPIWYQITQMFRPTNTNWTVSFFVDNFWEERTVKINQAHMEADAGKTVHENWKAYLDFNRSATALVEIVTDPDFRTEEEVVEFLKELQRLVRFNNVSHADLEKWQMRCDVNVSLRKFWDDEFWTRVELKNMNSFSAIRRAIKHEYRRQEKLLESWWVIDQETRWWNDETWSSYTMRSKEDALDYRYFPEPDLPVLELDDEFINNQREKLVESAFSRAKRYKNNYNFNKEFITPLISSKEISDFFEKLVKDWVKPRIWAKRIVNTVLSYLNDQWIELENADFSYDELKYILKQEQAWDLMENQWKDVFWTMIDTWKSAKEIIDEKWYKPQDDWELEDIVKETLKENSQAILDIKEWQMKAVWFLVGQIMKKSKWKANPAKAKDIIMKIAQEM